MKRASLFAAALALALSLALAVPTPLSPAVLASALPERPAVQAQESAPESPRIYPSSPEGAPAAYELRLPVLMYHHVIPGWQECNEMTVTVGRLETDLKWLTEHGYHTVLPR